MYRQYDNLTEIKTGMIIWDCVVGMCAKIEITSDPVEIEPSKMEGDELRRQWSWKGIHVDSGKEIDYLMVEGFEDYGPLLYEEPIYGKIV